MWRIAFRPRRVTNATSTAKFGYIRPVLSGAASVVAALFGDAIVWDAFIAVAGLPVPPAPVVRGHHKDRQRYRRASAAFVGHGERTGRTEDIEANSAWTARHGRSQVAWR
jgi:hypothetical protein